MEGIADHPVEYWQGWWRTGERPPNECAFFGCGRETEGKFCGAHAWTIAEMQMYGRTATLLIAEIRRELCNKPVKALEKARLLARVRGEGD